MLKRYHIEICQRALGTEFSTRALDVIIKANLAQDGLCGQIGHPEYHFDDNAFISSFNYMEEQSKIIKDMRNSPNEIDLAWQAFGRLTHCAQDFYAHSNYIHLWACIYHKNVLPTPSKVEALEQEIFNHHDLQSGKIYLWDWLAFIPGLHRLAKRILPIDSHTHMNLDSPSQGLLFPYAMEAAFKRTVFEFKQVTQDLNLAEFSLFTNR